MGGHGSALAPGEQPALVGQGEQLVRQLADQGELLGQHQLLLAAVRRDDGALSFDLCRYLARQMASGPLQGVAQVAADLVEFADGFQLVAMIWAPLGGVLGTSLVATSTLWFCLAATASTVVVTEVTKQIVARW